MNSMLTIPSGSALGSSDPNLVRTSAGWRSKCRSWVLVLGAGGLAGCGGGGGPGAGVEQNRGVIVFAAHEEATGESHLWAVDADGTNRRQLTDDPDYLDDYPRLSPDGRFVVFARLDPVSEETDHLAVLELTTNSLQQLPATAGALWPVFSPDGDEVAYFTDHFTMDAVQVSSPNTTRTIAFAAGGFLDWSVADEMVFTSVDGIYFVAAQGGTVSGPLDTTIVTSRWSPDGSRVLGNDVAARVVTLSAGGGIPQPLLGSGRLVTPMYAPSQVGFAGLALPTSTTRPVEILIVAVDGETRRSLFAPDGWTLSYFDWVAP